jgi:DNA polymerase/3'-5' exonuclease PolX
MTMHNAEVARVLARLADLLEIDGANPFRVRAYREAARIVGDLPQEVAALVAAGRDLAELPGIGRDLAGKIEELVRTGRLALLDETERRVPEGLLELLGLGGLGPKRVKTLRDQLGIKGLADLEAAARAGRIHDLPGFGARMEQRLLDALARHVREAPRLLLASVEGMARDLVRHLRAAAGVGEVVVAGSYRRRRETVGDLDILVTAGPDSDVMDRFVRFEPVAEVLGHGHTRSTVRLRSAIPARGRPPLEEVHAQPVSLAVAYRAHRGGEVPDIGPLDRCRDDQHRQACIGRAVVAQSPARTGGLDPVTALARAEAERRQGLSLRSSQAIRRRERLPPRQDRPRLGPGAGRGGGPLLTGGRPQARSLSPWAPLRAAQLAQQ